MKEAKRTTFLRRLSKELALPYWTFIGVVLFTILIVLFPPNLQQFYPPDSSALGSQDLPSVIPYPVGLPHAYARCPNSCLIDVCLHWIPGPSPRCPNPGPGGGCCIKYGQECDPSCSEGGDQPPSISGTVTCGQTGQNGWCVSNAQLVLNASDPQGYTVSIAGDLNGSPFTCGSSCTLDLPKGTGTAGYTVTADTSNLTASGSSTWNYDPDPPEPDVNVSGTGGANGWYISAVTVSAGGTDAISGIAGSSIFVDGGAEQSSATLGDGVHSVAVTATDNAGNTASKTFTISVDTTLPAISLSAAGTSGSGGWYVSNVEMTASATDTGSGVALIQYRIDGGAWSTGSTATVADGTHLIEFQAIDSAGNVSSTSMTVPVDTVGPATTIASPADGAVLSGILSVQGSATDATSNLASGSVSYDGGATWKPLTWSGSDWSDSWDTTSLPNGNYSIIVSSTDNAGNAGQTVSINVLLDNQPPTAEFLQPSINLIDSIGLKISPNVIPLKSVEIRVVDPNGTFPPQIFTFSPNNPPTSFHWDGIVEGSRVDPGTYRLKLAVCDIYGLCAEDRALLTVNPISRFISIFIPPATPTSTLVFTPTPLPLPTNTPMPTATSFVQRTPLPLVPVGAGVGKAVSTPTSTPSTPHALDATGTSGSNQAGLVLIGLLGLFAITSITDPRPRAIKRLGATIKRMTKD